MPEAGWCEEEGWLPTPWGFPSAPSPNPEPYHGAGEVVLGQTEIHHTLSAVELPGGQLRQDLWRGVQERRGTERERSQSAFPPGRG